MEECFRQSICWILRLFGLHAGRFKALRFRWIRLFRRRAVNRGGCVQFAALVSGYQSHEWAADQSKTHQSKLESFRTHSVANAKWLKRFQLNMDRNKCVQIYFKPWNSPDIWLFTAHRHSAALRSTLSFFWRGPPFKRLCASAAGDPIGCGVHELVADWCRLEIGSSLSRAFVITDVETLFIKPGYDSIWWQRAVGKRYKARKRTTFVK